MRSFFRNFGPSEDGVGAVEFALVFPMFLLVVIGAIEIGLSFFTHSGLVHGVNEAARYATVHPTPSNADLELRIKQSAFGISPGQLTLALSRGHDRELGDFIVIVGKYKHRSATSYLGLPDIDFVESRKAWIQPAF